MSCTKKKQEKAKPEINLIYVNKYIKPVCLEGFNTNALIDSGSDISLLKIETFEKLKQLIISKNILR